MNYNTVLFDFHGVFTSNVGRTAHALVQALREVGLDDINEAKKLLEGLLSRPKGELSKDYIRSEATTSSEELSHIFAKNNEYIYVKQYSWMIPKLKDMGVNIGIVSNGKWDDVTRCTTEWGWENSIDFICARGSNGNLGSKEPRKPSPQPINAALSRMQEKGIDIDPQKTIYVGDHENDIEAAHRAGIKSALIISGPGQLNRLRYIPDYFLTLHHLKKMNDSKEINGIPAIRMRDLPQLICGQNNISIEGSISSSKER